jgi:spore maturation protein CgeB
VRGIVTPCGKLEVHRGYLREFDGVLVHTSRSSPLLQALGARRVEMLLWPHFPALYHPLPTAAKDIDVLFVGTVSPYRRAVLERAAERFRVTVAQNVFHGEAAALYARAKVVLNIHFTPLRNLECRVSEALGCGAFLLTEPLDPDDLLLDRKHLAVFGGSNLAELDATLGISIPASKGSLLAPGPR